MSSFNMRISDNMCADFINGILKDVQVVEDQTLKKCAKIIKARAENNLRSTQKKHFNQNGHELRRPREAHMSDDVVIRSSKDRFGNKVVKIGGGKKTGTLWHIVNDGTYRSKATHFMDKTVNQTDGEIQSTLDQELRRSFE